MIVSLIVAISENGVIGKDGGIPWHLPADLKLFKQVTMGHYLVVGRKTFESIGKALPGRKMIVLSRQVGYKMDGCEPPGCRMAASLAEALDIARTAGEDEIFIGGGAAIYTQAIPLADRIYLSRVHAEVEGDTFFSEFDLNDWQEELTHHYPAVGQQEYDFTYNILIPKKNNRK
jgi:dihydrofolate reductase